MKTIMNTPFRLTNNQRRSAAAFMLACFLPTAALALPVAPQVMSGSAAISTSGSAMTITNSAGAIINWQGFSIGQGESTRFIQPSAASAVLNRITGGDPSKILGALQSNGTVLLINPNGILFGPNSRVDVGGLIASTLGISNQNFLAGRMNFSAGPVAGTVENQGAITTPGGGQVYLIAPDVTNSGVITAPNGDVLLAAGKEVLLVDKNSPEIALVISAPEHQAINLGTIVADAGRIGMYGGIIRQKGRISADSAVKDAGGRIFLKATREVTVEAGSSASADGIGSADGGKVVVWSDGATFVDGAISAKGGAEGGNGGFVETSGAYLAVNRAPDVSAPLGKGGTWLLDPWNIDIGATGPTSAVPSGTDPVTWTSDGSNSPAGTAPSLIQAGVIANALLSGSVIVDTAGSGTQAGNITVSAAINTSGTGGKSLTLNAHNDIIINQPVAVGASDLVLHADQDISGAGNVIINKDVTAANITAGGRDITFASLDGGSTYGKFIGGNVALTAANVITPNVWGFASEVAASSLNLTAVNGIGDGGKVFVGDVANQISFSNTNNGVRIYNTSASSTRSFTGSNANGPVRLESFDSAFPTIIGNLASGGDIILRMNNLTTAGGASINAGSNTVYLSAYSNSPVPLLSINGSQTFNLTDTDINKITSGKVIIGYDSFGNYTPSLSIGTSAALNLSVPQPIELYGQSITTGANAISLAGGPLTLIATGATSDIVINGAITKTAGANSALTLKAGRSIVINQPITSTANKLDINLNSHYQNDTTPGNVWVNNNLNTNGGNLVIGGGTNPALIPAIGYDATTSGGDKQYGVDLDKTTGGKAFIDTAGGNMSILGQGVDGSSFDSLGIYLGMAQIHANGGNVLLVGKGGANPLSLDNAGIYITDVVDTIGSGAITIQGAGGANTSATTRNRGVFVTTASALIRTSTGALNVIGSGGINATNLTNSNNQGVLINSGGTIQSTSGPINITGTAGSAGSVGIATSGTSANVTSTTAVTFKADKMSFAATGGTVGGAGSAVSLLPLSPGRPIVLGTDTGDSNPDLELSTNEFARFVTPRLYIGDDLSGPLSIGAAIAAPNAATLVLGSGGTIGQTSAGTISVANLAVKALGDVDLSTANNLVTADLAALLGNGSNLSRNFKFQNSGAINIGNLASIASVPGIPNIFGISTNFIGVFNSAAPDAVISLTSGGALTQTVGAYLGGKAVYVKGATVSLPYSNPTGIIAGEATGGSFQYKSANPIFVTTVDGAAGIQNSGSGGNISLNSTGGGISQDAPLSTRNVAGGGGFGLSLTTTGGVLLQNAGNNVAAISADLIVGGGTGSLSFKNNGNLLISGSVITNGNFIDIQVPPANGITVSGTVSAGTGVNGGLKLSGGGITCNSGTVSNSEFIGFQSTDPAQGITLNGGVVGTTNTKSIDLVTDKLTLSGGTAMVGSALGNSINISPFTAGRDIYVNPTDDGGALYITNTNTTIFNSPDFGIGSEAGNPNWAASGAIAVNAAISRAGGRVGLFSGAGVTQTAPITATSLGVIAGGAVNLTTPNQVANLAVETGTGAIDFVNSSALNIATMTGGGQTSTTITGLKSVGGGNISVSASAGNISLAAPIVTDTTVSTVTLQSPAASIVDAASGISITAKGLDISAYSGIGTLAAPLKTQVTYLKAVNGLGGGDISILNTGALITDAVTETKNSNPTGKVSITAQSPLTIGAGGVSSGSDIILTAGGPSWVTGKTGDNLTINGPVTSSAGNIVLTAGNAITGAGVLTASSVSGTGTVTKTANLNPPSAPPPPPPPTVAECTTNPALPGCSTILPTLDACTTNPTQAGCTAVLPTLDTCTNTPTAPGCTAVLPTLAICTTTPTAPGCTAVLPTLSICTATPTAPGCTAVLPTLDLCAATPSAPGCTAVLPTISTCTTTPTAPGCTAVLPSISVCTTTPTAPGCTAVLPTIALCATTPSAPGCTAVLPTISTCTTTPTAPGCTAVLPSISVCTTTPTAPGCTAVLPSLSICTTTPTAPGCTAVLPTISTCTTTPTAPGCTAVLPTLALCAATPSAPGCTAVLPTISTCTTTPTAPGCTAVLPSISVCTTTPTAPGCTAVLPSLATCTTNPATPGCSIVLPNIEQAPPTTQATTQVIKDIVAIDTTPIAPPGLIPVFLAKAVDDTPPPAGVPKTGDSGNKDRTSADSKDTAANSKDGSKDKDKDKDDKDKAKDSQEQQASSGDKKDAKPKKNYCN